MKFIILLIFDFLFCLNDNIVEECIKIGEYVDKFNKINIK